MARTEWLERRGFDHRALAASHEIVFTLADLRLTFKAPARLDDRLCVVSCIAETGRARLMFDQSIWCDDRLLIQGEFTVACVNIATFKPQRLPFAIREER